VRPQVQQNGLVFFAEPLTQIEHVAEHVKRVTQGWSPFLTSQMREEHTSYFARLSRS